MKRTMVSATVFVGVVALTGCSGSSPTTHAAASVSVSTSVAPAVTQLKAGDEVPFLTVLNKALSSMKAKRTTHAEMVLGSTTMAMDMDLGATGSDVSLSMDMNVDGKGVKMIYLNDVVYVQSPELGTDKWLKATADGTDELSQELAPMMKQLKLSAARNPLAALEGAQDLKAKVAKADSGGATYLVDLSREQVLAVAKQQGTPVDDALSAFMPKTVTYRLAMDPEDLPTVVEVQAGPMAVTMTYSQWGQVAPIVAPPESEVVVPTG